MRRGRGRNGRGDEFELHGSLPGLDLETGAVGENRNGAEKDARVEEKRDSDAEEGAPGDLSHFTAG